MLAPATQSLPGACCTLITCSFAAAAQPASCSDSHHHDIGSQSSCGLPRAPGGGGIRVHVCGYVQVHGHTRMRAAVSWAWLGKGQAVLTQCWDGHKLRSQQHDSQRYAWQLVSRSAQPCRQPQQTPHCACCRQQPAVHSMVLVGQARRQDVASPLAVGLLAHPTAKHAEGVKHGTLNLLGRYGRQLVMQRPGPATCSCAQRQPPQPLPTCTKQLQAAGFLMEKSGAPVARCTGSATALVGAAPSIGGAAPSCRPKL